MYCQTRRPTHFNVDILVGIHVGLPNETAAEVVGVNDDETHTPFILGKIPYGQILKPSNMNNIRRELSERGIAYGAATLWSEMIAALKRHEQNDKWFTPWIPYEDYVFKDG